MKHTIICILILVVISACKQPVNKVVGKDSVSVKMALAPAIKKDTMVKKVYPLTDSGQLMLHVDSLVKVTFPYESDGQYYNVEKNPRDIDLSIFKNKKIFHIPVKLIPIELGGGGLDDGAGQDTTFGLVDSATSKAEWTLVATTPKFIVIDVWGWGTLVTLSYNFDVIDAIHTRTGAGNNHWQIGRTTTINKDLTMTLHQSWTQTEAPEYDEDENEDWFIDNTGHFKKQPEIHKSKKHK